MNKKLSVGTIIFLILDTLFLIKVIGLFAIRDKFANIYSEFALEISPFQQFLIRYGYIVGIIIAAGVIIFILRTWLKYKTVTLKASIIIFAVLILWLIIYTTTLFVPIHDVANSVRDSNRGSKALDEVVWVKAGSTCVTGNITLEFSDSDTGRYTIFYGLDEDKYIDEKILEFNCTLTSKMTNKTVPLLDSSFMTATDSKNIPKWYFDIQQSGVYELTCWYLDKKRRPGISLTVGRKGSPLIPQ